MPTPSDETEVLASWGDLDAGPMNGESGRRLADHLLRLVAREPLNGLICDLGCGNGYLAARIAALGHRVVGVDASHRLLQLAEAHNRPSTVEYRYGLFGPELSGELARTPFDVVVSSDVMEHVYRPMSLIETAAAVLKPGGRLIICTPYHGYLKNVAISVLGQWDAHHGVAWDGGHIKFFSPSTLACMVRRCFRIDGFEYFGRVPWMWKNMICIATKPTK